MVLLATLGGVLMLASMALALEARGAATRKVLAGLERSHRDAVDAASARELLRGVLAEARRGTVPHPELSRLDGTPFELALDGRLWEARVNDVDGLVDLYLAPPEVLALLPADAGEILRRRQALLAELPPGARLSSETQLLARLGFDAAERDRLGPLVTQLARTGQVNPDLAPAAIRAAAAALPGADLAAGRTAEISLRRLPTPPPQ